MTDSKKNKSEKPLDKMTVKELREIAKEIPDLAGVHAMKKEDLLAAIKAEQGDAGTAQTPEADTKSAEKKPVAAPRKKGAAKKEKAKLTKQDIKGLIKGLRAKREKAISDKDRKRATIFRRQISRLKKQTRKKAA